LNDDVEEVYNDDVNYVQGITEGVFSGCSDTKMVFVGVMMSGIYGGGFDNNDVECGYDDDIQMLI